MGAGLNLLQALRAGQAARIAFVGAGGKTTALFQLARQLQAAGAGTILLTTTTHLAVSQLELADRILEATSREQIAALDASLPAGVIIVHGGLQGERVSGLTDELFAALFAAADRHSNPILVEADGSRQRPLKAPGAHEPAIPGVNHFRALDLAGRESGDPRLKGGLDCVVVCAGLSGLGKPLDSQWVHRLDSFARLSGLESGAEITAVGLARVLSHPQGGLKNIPTGVRRVALLNQADTPELQAVGGRLGEELIGHGYDAAVTAALNRPRQAGLAPVTTSRFDSPEVGEIFLTLEPTAGIVLAAGESSRFGQPKQLLTWGGETLVHRASRTALEAGLDPVVVVTGAHTEEVQRAVADLAVQPVFNPAWAAGQSSSVATGLRSLPAKCGGAIFLLADQPQTPAALLRSLSSRHAETLAAIVAPLVDGRRGTPVLFDRTTFPDFSSLQGDTGGRALFQRFPVTWLPWHDSNLLLDIDQPGDYQKLLGLEAPE